MAYSKYHTGTKYNHDGTDWRKIAMWTDGSAVELIGEGNANLPNSMGSQTTLAAFITQFNGAIAAANGFATLGGDGKLTASQLPSSVGGGLAYSGTIDASTQDLDDLATALGGTDGDKSKYVVVTTAGTISDAASTAKWELNTYDDGVTVNSATLEVGDKILCTNYDTDHHVFTVLNVSYGDASTSAKGIVTLSDVATRATLSGDHVITEGILATILNDDLLVDGDFPSAGFMKTDGSGGYSVDNSTFLTQSSFDTNNNELAALQLLADTAGFVKKTGDGTYSIDTNTYLTSETSHADVLVDGDFASAGLMTTNGSGGYSITATSTYQTKVTVDSGAPSGGADGDLWIVTS